MPETPLAETLTPLELAALGTRVYCDDLIGFGWQVAEAPASTQLWTRMNTRNDALLRALSMLEEQDEAHGDDTERLDVQRLEGKLNLILELLADLVRERNPGLTLHMVRFSAEGLCWRAQAALPADTLLLTDWYMQPAWPVALRIHARVLGCVPDGDQQLISARFEGVSEAVRDSLDKLVFRRHRRSVAQSRIIRSSEAAPV